MPKQTRRVTDQSHAHPAADAPLIRARDLFARRAPPGGCAARSRLRLAALLFAARCLFPGYLSAQEAPSTPGEAIGRIFDAVKLRNERPQPPDFVTRSRPESLDYKPLAPTDRENHRKTPQQLEAIDAELAGAAARNRAAATQVAVPDAAAPPKARAKTAR